MYVMPRFPWSLRSVIGMPDAAYSQATATCLADSGIAVGKL